MPESRQLPNQDAVQDAVPAYRMTLPETTQEHLPPQYKRTEVGIIPVDWMVKFLRKISLMKSGESITSAKIDESSPYPCYGGNGLRGFTDKYTHDGDYVLIGRQGALCGNVVRVAGQFYASEHAVVATPRDGVDVDWLSFILDTMQLNRISESSAQPGLSVQKVLSLQSVVPPSEDEQRAIATALSDADALIESLDRLIAKKRAIKQAAMQQLLTGETRLEGFEGSWKTKRLEEISTITIGRTPNRDNPDLWGEGYVWLSIADLDRKVVDRSKEHITDLAARGMRIVEEGTLLMSFKLSIGRVCFAGCDLFTNEAICALTDLEANAEFLYYALSRTDFSRYGRQAVKGYTLNRQSLKAVEVNLPPRDEQAAIAATLRDMDTEIEALASRRDKSRQIKQGMMQELLTGRTRLVAPQQEAVEEAEA